MANLPFSSQLLTHFHALGLECQLGSSIPPFRLQNSFFLKGAQPDLTEESKMGPTGLLSLFYVLFYTPFYRSLSHRRYLNFKTVKFEEGGKKVFISLVWVPH